MDIYFSFIMDILYTFYLTFVQLFTQDKSLGGKLQNQRTCNLRPLREREREIHIYIRVYIYIYIHVYIYTYIYKNVLREHC